MFFTESSTKDNKSEKAMFLGKWLWVLFWLFIPSIIASAMVNENIASLFPALLVSGQILQTGLPADLRCYTYKGFKLG